MGFLNRCVTRAKKTVRCPGINNHITNLIMNCEICVRNRPSKVKPMIRTEIMQRPLSMLEVDLAERSPGLLLQISGNKKTKTDN